MSSALQEKASASSGTRSSNEKRLVGRWGERDEGDTRADDAIDQPGNQRITRGKGRQSEDTRSLDGSGTAAGGGQIKTTKQDLEEEEEDKAAEDRPKEPTEKKIREKIDENQVEDVTVAAGDEEEQSQASSDVVQQDEDNVVALDDPDDEENSNTKPKEDYSSGGDHGTHAVAALQRLEMDIASKSRLVTPTVVQVRHVESRDLAYKERNEEDSRGARFQIHRPREGGDIEQDTRPPSCPVAVAVATPVDGPTGRKPLPYAAEEDTTDLAVKPPIYKNRRFRVYGLVVGLMALIIAVGIIAVVVIRSQRQNDSSAAAAPISERQAAITKQLEAVVGGPGMFAEADSPPGKALEWIVNKDPRQLDPASPNLVRRFLLALFYYDTSQDGPWASCNPPLEAEGSASCIYESEYPDVFAGSGDRPAFRWLSRRPECDWSGIYCDDSGEIRFIDLGGQRLSGELPAYFEHFHLLQHLALGFNFFVGTVPASWARLQHLISIDLFENFLSGTFPDELLQLSNLRRIYLSINQFTGTIPSEIANLSLLRSLTVGENELTGTIPTELGDLSLLGFLRLLNNQLTGTIPTELGRLTLIDLLEIGRNPLTGTVPTELGRLTMMNQFYAHFTSLEGTLPTELFTSQIGFLYLHNNNMTGTIDPLIGQCQKLERLVIHNNRFHGPLPSELGLLSSLDYALLHFNDFSGSVPQELCDLRGPGELNRLDTDCAPEGGDGEIGVECPAGCCTNCCDPIFEECVPWDSVRN